VRSTSLGFGAGTGVGVALALVALVLSGPAPEGVSDASFPQGLATWVEVNLGHSVWLFTAVLVLYVFHLRRLRQLLTPGMPHSVHDVVELDQLIDVWTHLFVGIGVIWTAIGTRNALQAALGDPAQALTDTAGHVLGRLVDGGILLALTTTIVGGIGGYLMRLGKTVVAGAALQAYFEEMSREEIKELLAVVKRIESTLWKNDRPDRPDRRYQPATPAGGPLQEVDPTSGAKQA
jgi:hypothetical protein